MRRFKSHIAIFGTLLLFAALVGGCGNSGNREGQIGTAQTSSVVVQKGDPVIAGASGYVGSAACASCHPTQFAGWGKSLHNSPLKTLAELGDAIFVNDYNSNGVNDFKKGLDFNSAATDNIIDATLKGLRPNAPILSFAGGKYFIQLGPAGTRFEIQRIQGGNGYWKQRYQTKVGRGYYISPVQYQEKTNVYVNYNASHWYNGTTPRYTAAYGSDALVVQFGQLGATGTNGTQRSWENRCAGCHQTGLTAKAETTTYGGTPVEEVVTGYSELNIGCESCHGPGATHAASRNPADIINPDNFKALGVPGLRAANQVCGSCHSRGEGNATLLSGSSPLHLEYPARKVFGALRFPLPGDSVVDNSAANPFVIMAPGVYGFVTTTGSTDPTIASWYNNWYNGFGFTYAFPTYVASRQHHQQWLDMEQGPHGTDQTFDVTCWSCHDAHAPAGSHQIRETIVEDGVTIKTQNDDDSLCLACHAGFGDFAAVTKTQVATIASGNPDPALVAAVVAHTKHSFNPTASGILAASRCSECHMPKTASSAIPNDIHNHTFLIIEPSLSKAVGGIAPAGVRNSCNACHSAGDMRIDPSGALTGDAYLDALQAKFVIKFP